MRKRGQPNNDGGNGLVDKRSPIDLISTLRPVDEGTYKLRSDARIISSCLLAVRGGDDQAENPAEIYQPPKISYLIISTRSITGDLTSPAQGRVSFYHRDPDY
jgi:hypothetical protein